MACNLKQTGRVWRREDVRRTELPQNRRPLQRFLRSDAAIRREHTSKHEYVEFPANEYCQHTHQ